MIVLNTNKAVDTIIHCHWFDYYKTRGFWVRVGLGVGIAVVATHGIDEILNAMWKEIAVVLYHLAIIENTYFDHHE